MLIKGIPFSLKTAYQSFVWHNLPVLQLLRVKRAQVPIFDKVCKVHDIEF